MDDNKDPQNTSNYDMNDFNNQNQLGDYFSNQYKIQMNNRYKNQSNDDVDNLNEQLD